MRAHTPHHPRPPPARNGLKRRRGRYRDSLPHGEGQRGTQRRGVLSTERSAAPIPSSLFSQGLTQATLSSSPGEPQGALQAPHHLGSKPLRYQQDPKPNCRHNVLRAQGRVLSTPLPPSLASVPQHPPLWAVCGGSHLEQTAAVLLGGVGSAGGTTSLEFLACPFQTELPGRGEPGTAAVQLLRDAGTPSPHTHTHIHPL